MRADPWRDLGEWLGRERSAVLVVVVQSTGDAPGRAGFLLVVPDEGDPSGTVGGGAIESEAVRIARELLLDDPALARDRALPAFLRDFDHRSDSTIASGAVCGGSQTLAFVPIDPSRREIVRLVALSRRGDPPGLLRISPRGLEFAPAPPSPREDLSGGRRAARIPLQPPPRFVRSAPADWLYEEDLDRRCAAVLIGAGHVGASLSRLLSTLDFRVLLVDDRGPAVATFRDDAWADEKLAIPYDRLAEVVPDGPGVFVVIATAGHEADFLAARQLVSRELAYLAILGSARKAALLKEQLRESGAAAEAVARIATPAGLPIHSHTADEIAVSIAAQMIAVRNAPERPIL